MGANYDQLDLNERIETSPLFEAVQSRCEIGRMMGRSVSKIGQELRHNAMLKGGYKPGSVDRIALSRRRRLSRIERLSPLRSVASDRLRDGGWSPEQIAGRLKLEESVHAISHESIHRFIDRPRLRRENLRRTQPQAKVKRGRCYFKRRRDRIPDRRSIHERPQLIAAENNSDIGKATSRNLEHSAATC